MCERDGKLDDIFDFCFFSSAACMVLERWNFEIDLMDELMESWKIRIIYYLKMIPGNLFK